MSSEDAALVTLCVADANILIDLENGGILRLLFELPYHFIIWVARACRKYSRCARSIHSFPSTTFLLSFWRAIAGRCC